MHSDNPSTAYSVLCPLTGKLFCRNASCSGHLSGEPVCQGDKRSEELGITCYPNDDALVKRKLQAKFTGIPQDSPMTPSPTAVSSCAHHTDFLGDVRRQLFHSSPVMEREPDYVQQFLRYTPEEGPSHDSVSFSTPTLGPIRAPIPPPAPVVRSLDHSQQNTNQAYDDTETQKRLKNQRVVLPPTDSEPVGYIQPPHHVPAFENFILPMSCDEFGLPRSIRRDPKLHGLIEQQASGHESITRNETITNHQLTSQQVAPVREEEQRLGQGANAANIGRTAYEDLPSLTMRFQPPKLDTLSLETANQCYHIGSLILKKHGAEYAKKGRTNRFQEVKNHCRKLEGRIGKRQGPKREGEKFFLEKKAEVRMYLRYEILSRFNRLPLKKKKHTVRVRFPEVPFKTGLLQVPALPPETAELSLPEIDAHTPAELAEWLWKVQERIVPAFLCKRKQAVRKALNDARDENKKKSQLRNGIDAKVRAVERADFEATHWFIFEYFVKLGFS